MISGRSGVRGSRISTPRKEADAERRAADERARAAAELGRLLAPDGGLVVDGIAWRVAVTVDALGDARATASIAPDGLVSVWTLARRRGRLPGDVAAELERELRAQIADAHAGVLGIATRLGARADTVETHALLVGMLGDDKPRLRALRRAARYLVERDVSDGRIADLAAMVDP